MNGHSSLDKKAPSFWSSPLFFALGFAILLFIFFAPVFLGTHGFYGGDHREQHYPWWVFLSQQIKLGQLPVWTQQIACGFPILAEGQIGVLYPLNLLFAFLLPARMGYDASILFHFILGGLFFLLYCRTIGLKQSGAVFSTLLYVFGSARAGYFYNITSQRVLIWFPLALFFIERFLQKEKKLGSLLGIFTCSWLIIIAGYQQYAIYALCFISLYAFLRTLVYLPRPHDSESLSQSKHQSSLLIRLRSLGLIALAITLALIASSPQMIPFMQLVKTSSRTVIDSSIAFTGSASPLGLITLFYPDWDFIFTTELYIGSLGIFFLLCLLRHKKSSEEKALLFLMIFSYLLAIGVYNPLFILFVKLTGFTGRIPAKFLYFTATFLAILAGFGLDRFLDLSDQVIKRTLSQCYTRLALCVLAIYGVAAFALRFGKTAFLNLGEVMLQLIIIGKPGHPHSVETYHAKLLLWYEGIIARIGFTHLHTLLFTLFLISSIFLVRYFCQGKRRKSLMLMIILVFTLCELRLYAEHAILGNVRPVSFLKQSSTFQSFIQASKGRVYTLTLDGNYDHYALHPNLNMVYGIDDIGGYSPLIPYEYKIFMSGLGGINDSLEITTGQADSVALYRNKLNFLGARWVLSPIELQEPDLFLTASDDSLKLYENRTAGSGAYLLNPAQIKRTSLDIQFQIEDALKNPLPLASPSEHELQLNLNMPSRAYVILAHSFHPGWMAYLDDLPVDIIKANKIFMGILIPSGEHQLKLKFSLWKSIKSGLSEG